MTLQGKKVLILLGGTWHDFDGFAANMRPMLEGAGCIVESTYDLNRLTELDQSGVDLIISYTSLGQHREGYNDTGPEIMTTEQIRGLLGWVRAGGGLLAAHCATVLGESDPEMGELMGGVFVSHPPQFSFPVYPIAAEHPITAGIEAFSVHDEFYIEQLVAPVDIHMTAIDRGAAYPMVWSKSEGQGRVAHIAMGHSELVWNLPSYRQLMLQALDWVAQKV
jgi:type 1 glutamine amidotransferase